MSVHQQPRRFLQIEKVVVQCWLTTLSGGKDPERHAAFERDLRALFRLCFHAHEMQKAYEKSVQIENDLAAQRSTPSTHQLTRYHFICGVIGYHLPNREFSLISLEKAVQLLSPLDREAWIVATYWLGYVRGYWHHHPQARLDFDVVIDAVERTKGLRFQRGNRRLLLMYLRFWRAKAYFGSGIFAKALAELSDLHTQVQGRIMTFSTDYPSLTRDEIAEKYEFSLTQRSVLPIAALCDNIKLEKVEVLQLLCDLYFNSIWLWALTLYFGDKLNPSEEARHEFLNLRDGMLLMKAVIREAKKLSFLKRSVPPMFFTIAELALSLSEYDQSATETQMWLDEARKALVDAQTFVKMLPSGNTPMSDFDQVFQLTEQLAAFHQAKADIREKGDISRVWDLLPKTVKLQKAASNRNNNQLLGRVSLLLGEIYAELGFISQADAEYARALAVFEYRQEHLRSQETWNARWCFRASLTAQEIKTLPRW